MKNITHLTLFRRYFASLSTSARGTRLAIIKGFLFCTLGCLQAAQMEDKLSDQHQHTKEVLMISPEKNFSGMNFEGKRLPQDLSYANLTNANLAGHHFSDTNFTGAQLNEVNLTGTTCDYLQCFEDNAQNMLAKRLKCREWNHHKDLKTNHQWYFADLPKELKNIAQVYPGLSEDSHKAELLQIACNLAYLPYYEGTEYYIKVEYWSCRLLMLKKQLGDLGDQLVCVNAGELAHEATDYCWQTDYPAHLECNKGVQIASWWSLLAIKNPLPSELCLLIQDYLTERLQKVHANFDEYLQLFQERLVKYNVKSKTAWAYDFYQKTIQKNLEGLKKVYPKLRSQKKRKEVMEIAHELSQKYKMQHFNFFLSFLDCQIRLIELKKSVDQEVKNDIHYSVSSVLVFRIACWSAYQ